MAKIDLTELRRLRTDFSRWDSWKCLGCAEATHWCSSCQAKYAGAMFVLRRLDNALWQLNASNRSKLSIPRQWSLRAGAESIVHEAARIAFFFSGETDTPAHKMYEIIKQMAKDTV